MMFSENSKLQFHQSLGSPHETNWLNSHNCKLISRGPLRKQSLFFLLTRFPIPTKVKIGPGVSNRGEKSHHWFWLSLNTPIRRGSSVYTEHVCLNLNKDLISREHSTFHAPRSQTPSLEGSGTCEEVISTLDEDCCCFELKRLEVAHLGSRNQPVTYSRLRSLQKPEK